MQYCVLDKRTPIVVREWLRAKGIQVVLTCEIPGLKPPLNTHTDIQLVKVGERLVCAPCLFSYYCQFFPNVISGKSVLFETYPKDAAYNCLTVGKKLFHRLDITDPIVLMEAEKQGFSLVSVRQGYAACSTLVLTDSAVVTADAGMAKAMENEGIEVYCMTPGEVSLLGFSYGFVGGAGGRLFGKELLLFGTPQDSGMLSFIKEHGKEPLLFPNRLEDFGGLVLWEQEKS